MYPYIEILNLNIPTYGLCVCFAIVLCSILVFDRARKENIDFNDLTILIAISIGSGMLGGVILYIFVTYDMQTLYKQIATLNLSFLKNPGIVFYGGLIGGILGCVVTTRILKINVEQVERCIVPFIPLGHAIGRVGCLMAGCCYGFPYCGIFAVSTTFDIGNSTYFPIQAIEALLNILIMTALLIYTKKERRKYSVLSFYLIMYSILRFILEFYRGDAIRGKYLLFSTSQWISLILLLFSVIIMIKNSYKQKI